MRGRKFVIRDCLGWLLVGGVLWAFGAQTVQAQTSTGWPMVAANPQRTGWTPDELASGAHVEWYRPIDAYIPPNFQVIAANDLVYISSARGLYAMRYDTGSVVWRYDTEMPLGNSPTIATINGTSMAFVGGYDKKIHAFNALTGLHLWEFTGAKAGFDANPLVINNTVYVGNRDGHFYAINATNGSLAWQYPQANQDGIGPIHLSPAYKNNTIYFATDYNYGYALNMNGTLKWKSQKLIGDGYNNYWPMVYTDPTDGKDYVIFTAKIPYREANRPGTYPNSSSYYMYGEGISAFPQSVTVNGVAMLDYSVVASYLNQKPHLRIYTVLEGSNGSETKYLPAFPQANPNTQAPPVLNGGYLFVNNDRGNARHHIMGWKFGTNYFVDTALDGAGDEPLILSAGGDNVYKVLCCSRAAWYTSLPNLSNSPELWPYGGNSLGNIAPGYDEKLFYILPGHLDNISAQYGNINGVYGYHGNANPMVPYKGKLYTIKGNSILAFGPGTARGKLALLTSSAPVQTVMTLSTPELTASLEKEVQKIVSAGILKPGYTDDSQFSSSSMLRLLTNYFDNPGDTLYTLSIAYPYLSATTKGQVKSYLKNTIYSRYFQNGIMSRIGWKEGVQRDSIPYPPDLAADMQTLDDNYDWNYDGSLSWNYTGYNVNYQNYYALWKYAQIVAPEDTQAIYNLVLAKIGPTWWGGSGGTVVPPPATDDRLRERPYELNAYIAGYYGFLKLQEMAGKTTDDADARSAITATYNHLHDLRVNNFSKDNPYTGESGYGQNFLSLSRNFIWLTLELASDLRASKLSQIQQALNEYNSVGPYWFVSKFGAAVAESGQQNLYDYPSNFQARAWILRSTREELSKWLDIPAFERGDLFYIQNLVALIEAPYAGASPTPGSTSTPPPVATNTPTRTPTPTTTLKSGDANGDGRVDGLDYVAWLNHYGLSIGGTSNGDFNGDGRVDGLDYVIWLNNYGK